MELVLAVVLAVIAATAVWFLHPARAEAKRLREQGMAQDGRMSEVESQLKVAEGERNAAREDVASLEATVKSLEQTKVIAAEVMELSGEGILKRVREQLEDQNKLRSSEIDRQKEAIDGLVKPVKENLQKVEKQINEMEQKRENAYGELGKQVDLLAEQSGRLNNILQSTSQRGSWAEEQLENILELAGMKEHVDFTTQQMTDDKGGRPDVVVTIPNGAKVVIDSKFPLVTDQEEADRSKEEVQEDYAKRLKDHTKTLGKKDYAKGVDGRLDFIVMFVPSTPILDEAMAFEPEIWQNAWRDHKVLIATPGLLISLLRTIAISWDRDTMSRNAEEVFKQAKTMYDGLIRYAEHVNGMGKNIRLAMQKHNSGIEELEKSLIRPAKTLAELGLGTSKLLPHLEEIAGTPHTLMVPEAIDTEAIDAEAEDARDA